MKELKDFTYDEYESLKATGMLWELFIDASGSYIKDCHIPKLTDEGRLMKTPENFLKEGSMRWQVRNPTITEKPINPPPSPKPKPNIKVGSEWWVKYPNSTTLSKETVVAITDKTVTLKGEICFGKERTYKREDIEFVEEIKWIKSY